MKQFIEVNECKIFSVEIHLSNSFVEIHLSYYKNLFY